MQAILVNVGVIMRCRDFGGRIIVYVLLFWSIMFIIKNWTRYIGFLAF